MNKDKTTRTPIPEDLLALFVQQMWISAKLTGADKIPAVVQHIQLIEQEVDRHHFNSNHQVSSHDKDEADKRTFIAIFRNRYLESTDFEYPVSVTGVDIKLISQVNKSLQGKGFTCDEYLKWLFEVFLPENTKFLPATVKFSCSNFVLTRFFYDNKEMMKEKQEKELRKRESLALMSRGRQVIRQSKTPAEVEKVKNIIKNYMEGRIMIDGLRKGIEECERMQSRPMAQETQGVGSQPVAGE